MGYCDKTEYDTDWTNERLSERQSYDFHHTIAVKSRKKRRG